MDENNNSTMINPDASTTASSLSEIRAAAQRVRRDLDAAATNGVVSDRDRVTAAILADREVLTATVHGALDESANATRVARRVLAGAALHVLGEDALRDVRDAAMAGGSHICLLCDMSRDAALAGKLERAIAAGVLVSVGNGAIVDTLRVRARSVIMWGDDPDEMIGTQRCMRHNVFCCPDCCPDCSDEPAPPVAPIGRAGARRFA